MQGTVVWFNNAKGYGFVQDQATSKEYFCHYSAIQSDGYKSLKAEQRVSFDLEQGPQGTQASDVKVIV